MVAAAVSFMETFQVSLRELNERFTKSELVLMGWRSEEQYVDMFADARLTASDVKESFVKLEAPDNPDAEPDLSKMKGKEALRALSKLGIMTGFPM